MYFDGRKGPCQPGRGKGKQPAQAVYEKEHTMRNITRFMLIVSGIGLAGCAPQKHTSTPMPPITQAQVYTEPEQRVANPGSLFSASENVDMYADNRARHVGDIVLIKIVENSKSKSKADTDASRTSGMSIDVTSALGNKTVGPLMGASSLLSGKVGEDPLLASQYGSNMQAKGETKRENYVTATIGARVLQVLPGGVLQIQGAREVRVNEETQYMVVSGLVRSRDISSDNSVDSTQLADSKVEYYGEGVLGDKQKAGWLSRLLDNVWPL